MSCSSCDNCNKASIKGHLDCLTRIISAPGFQISSSHSRACINAARYGNLRCLQYAHEAGIPLGEIEINDMILGDIFIVKCNAINTAIIGGHLSCLAYVYQHKPEYLNKDAFILCAMKGHLECLKFVHQKRDKWYKGTAAICAAYGHVDCLAYAIEHGAPYDQEEFEFFTDYHSEAIKFYPDSLAAAHGHVACLEYLLSKHFPKSKEAIHYAMKQQNTETARLLISYGYTCDHISDSWWTNSILKSHHLDDKIWRTFLFSQTDSLTNSPILRNVISDKKKEIKDAFMIVNKECILSDDIAKHIVFHYI